MTRREFGALAVGGTFLLRSQTALAAAGPFTLRDLRLYQPEAELEGRISVEALSTFAKALQAGFIDHTKGSLFERVEGALVAVAIRPGKKQRVWCELVGNSPPAVASAVEKKLSAVAAPEAKGLVAFALNFVREGRTPKVPEIPRSWQKVAVDKKRAIRIPDEAVNVVWPE